MPIIWKIIYFQKFLPINTPGFAPHCGRNIFTNIFFKIFFFSFSTFNFFFFLPPNLFRNTRFSANTSSSLDETSMPADRFPWIRFPRRLGAESESTRTPAWALSNISLCSMSPFPPSVTEIPVPRDPKILFLRITGVAIVFMKTLVIELSKIVFSSKHPMPASCTSTPLSLFQIRFFMTRGLAPVRIWTPVRVFPLISLDSRTPEPPS